LNEGKTLNLANVGVFETVQIWKKLFLNILSLSLIYLLIITEILKLIGPQKVSR